MNESLVSGSVVRETFEHWWIFDFVNCFSSSQAMARLTAPTYSHQAMFRNFNRLLFCCMFSRHVFLLSPHSAKLPSIIRRKRVDRCSCLTTCDGGGGKMKNLEGFMWKFFSSKLSKNGWNFFKFLPKTQLKPNHLNTREKTFTEIVYYPLNSTICTHYRNVRALCGLKSPHENNK